MSGNVIVCAPLQGMYDTLGLAQDRKLKSWRTAMVASLETTSLRNVVQTVLSNETLFDQVARASYRHPNGFDKLILFRDASGAMIKLDAWWSDDDQWGEIHNHRFDFSSIVMSGALQFRHYLESNDGSMEEQRSYRVTDPTSTDHLVSRPIRLTQAWEGSMESGSSYDLECHMYHMARGTVGRDTITLVAQAAPRRSYSEALLGRPYLPPLIDLTHADVRDRLERIEALDV